MIFFFLKKLTGHIPKSVFLLTKVESDYKTLPLRWHLPQTANWWTNFGNITHRGRKRSLNWGSERSEFTASHLLWGPWWRFLTSTRLSISINCGWATQWAGLEEKMSHIPQTPGMMPTQPISLSPASLQATGCMILQPKGTLQKTKGHRSRMIIRHMSQTPWSQISWIIYSCYVKCMLVFSVPFHV